MLEGIISVFITPTPRLRARAHRAAAPTVAAAALLARCWRCSRPNAPPLAHCHSLSRAASLRGCSHAELERLGRLERLERLMRLERLERLERRSWLVDVSPLLLLELHRSVQSVSWVSSGPCEGCVNGLVDAAPPAG